MVFNRKLSENMVGGNLFRIHQSLDERITSVVMLITVTDDGSCCSIIGVRRELSLPAHVGTRPLEPIMLECIDDVRCRFLVVEDLQAVFSVVLHNFTTLEGNLYALLIRALGLSLDGLFANLLELPDAMARGEERLFQPDFLVLLHLLDVCESFQYESGFPIVSKSLYLA